MIPREAIEKAIEGGGWVDADIAWRLWRHDEMEYIYTNPTFWQALGKTLGWKEPTNKNVQSFWEFKAHCFYQIIISGGDTAAFWVDLLK